MANDLHEEKQYEAFGRLVVPKGKFIMRLDGSNFSTVTEVYDKPLDKKFAVHMVGIVKDLMKFFTEIEEAITHSDEISLLFGDEAQLFNRRLEKLVSEVSSFASAKFVSRSGLHGHFDARIIYGMDWKEYSKYRRLDSFRSCVNGWSYWKLRESGLNARNATKKLHKIKSKEKQELLFNEFNINCNDLPKWQKQGFSFKREQYTKQGYNPIKKCSVEAFRTRIIVDNIDEINELVDKQLE